MLAKPDSANVQIGGTDHYESGKITLSKFTANGKSFRSLLYALHEAAHANQHAENCVVWKMHSISRWFWIGWLVAVLGAIIAAWLGEYYHAIGMMMVAFLFGVMRAYAIGVLENDAWDRTEKWVEKNLITSDVEAEMMDEIRAQSILSYTRLFSLKE